MPNTRASTAAIAPTTTTNGTQAIATATIPSTIDAVASDVGAFSVAPERAGCPEC